MIKFTKMVASGNDFIIIVASNQKPVTRNPKLLARRICNRKYGIGADGLLLLEKSKIADIKMRIFNPDGTEAKMCGNGAKCVAFWLKSKIKNQKSKFKVESKVGIIESEVNGNNVKIKFTEPKDIKLDIPIRINNRPLKVNFVNTGVPHTIIFVEGLDRIDIVNLGRRIRYHQRFQPEGTNVDFVEVLNKNSIKIRTYERGVEDETLSCGTGAVAASLISKIKNQKSKLIKNCKVNVYTKSGEVLRVYFDKIENKFKNIWLEGKARIVYKGVYNV